MATQNTRNKTFLINRPGYAYRLNTRTWDPDWDSFERNVPETGNLYGGRSASNPQGFYVPENDTYRSQLNRGDVYVGNNTWCYTAKPQTEAYLTS